MEVSVKQVENGYVVRFEGEDPVDGFVQKEFVFTRMPQVVKFLRENLKEQK